MRAERTADQASGSCATSSTASKTGDSSPTTTAAEASPENAVSTSITSLTRAEAEPTPRSRARCIRSWKSGSSNAPSSTWLVSA